VVGRRGFGTEEVVQFQGRPVKGVDKKRGVEIMFSMHRQFYVVGDGLVRGEGSRFKNNQRPTGTKKGMFGTRSFIRSMALFRA